MHGVCAGFSTREELIKQTSSYQRNNPRISDVTHCPFCQFKSGQDDEKIGSRATLIVTPPSILNQWTREIRKHTSIKSDGNSNNAGKSLKVLIYPGVKEICSLSHAKAVQSNSTKMLLPRYLADADG